MQLQQPCEPRAPWGRQGRAAGEAQHNRLPQGSAGLSLPPATPAKALLALAQFVPGLSLWPELNSVVLATSTVTTIHLLSTPCPGSWTQSLQPELCPHGATQCQAGMQQQEIHGQWDSPGQNKP